MMTLLAFVVTLGILITVHEYGHYRVAVACGIKVLRFSIGFGPVLWRWQPKRPRPGQNTEFVLAALPLGGYVRMLDEREGAVAVEDVPHAFNRQRLRARVAVVAAGPVANLLLAVLLYALVGVIGVEQAQPVLSAPVAGSIAERAGLRSGDWVQATSDAGAAMDGEPEAVRSFQDLRWRLSQAALSGRDVVLWVGRGENAATQAVTQPVTLNLSGLQARELDAALWQDIGLLAPWSAPQIGQVLPDGAAEAAGLLAGDVVRRVDGREVPDALALRQWIRAGVDAQGQTRVQRWTVQRQGQALALDVTPAPEQREGQWWGRIGAMVGAQPALVLVRQNPWEALTAGAERVWDVSLLSLKMLGRMLIGQASLKNLSGPITIADYAGQSAQMGLTAYLSFLALISVSLGVLNLLPLPMLDGGHLMYYLWEGMTGRAVSDAWMERLQRGGVAVLLLLMSVALFNDVARLWG